VQPVPIRAAVRPDGEFGAWHPIRHRATLARMCGTLR
jgi:hypothetical protein